MSSVLARPGRKEAAAFARLYERHHQELYRYCRSILRHEQDAQDALQSTLERAFTALSAGDRDIEPRPYLFRIAHNEAISILRRRRPAEPLEDAPQPGAIDDVVQEREALRVLRADLSQLPERQRAALVLRELSGLGHAEIGQVLGISAAAVKQAIFDARTALFTFREGREMPCADVRRALSDGDGRVLRGRGLRAHLRACAGCRAFRAELTQRPRLLAALCPPLPAGGAVALLAQLLGGGSGAVAAKVMVGVAVVAVAVPVARHHAPPPPPAAAHAQPRALPAERGFPIRRLAATDADEPSLGATPSARRPRPADRAEAEPRKRARPEHAPRREGPRSAPHGGTGATPRGHAKSAPHGGAVATPPKRTPPGQAKKEAKPTPPGQAKKEAKPTPPGRAKESKPVPPGQAKKEAEATPPGQAKKVAPEPAPVASPTPGIAPGNGKATGHDK